MGFTHNNMSTESKLALNAILITTIDNRQDPLSLPQISDVYNLYKRAAAKSILKVNPHQATPTAFPVLLTAGSISFFALLVDSRCLIDDAW